MNDNEYNNNHDEDKEPWEKPSEDGQNDVQPEDNSELKQEAPAQPEQDWQDVSSSQTEEPKSEEKPAAPDEPTAEQPAANPYQQPGQYQNPQNPYTPYGQYNNPYNGYNNPYGNYNNPYGTYGQNQNNQAPYQQGQQSQYNPQGQQYWTYQQYGGQQQQNGQQPKQPKRKNAGLRVFLWILGILVAGSVLGFCIYGVYTAIDFKESGLNNTNSQVDQGNGANNNNNGGTAGGSASSQAQIQGSAPGDGTNPNSTGVVINSKPGGDELSAKQVYKNVAESVVGVETTVTDVNTGESGVGQGTGIIATSDGYILTNAHVVNYSRSNKVKVILHNSKEYAATVVGYDKTSDIAVLKINATDLTPATFGDASQLEVGDQVIAIGNPGGMSYASSLTGGYVSALDRSIESHSDNGMTYIQTDAAINPGNSGGPLLNMYGQVVGINSNKIVATGYEGMGFAIPVSKAKTIIDDLIAHGYVSGRSRLGITASTVQSQLTGLPAGVKIQQISTDSDLKNSNVVVGDIITKADGKAITSLDDLYAVLNSHKAGDTITLTVFSQSTSGGNGVQREVRTKLLEDKGETQAK